jgi:hypothetical protein
VHWCDGQRSNIRRQDSRGEVSDETEGKLIADEADGMRQMGTHAERVIRAAMATIQLTAAVAGSSPRGQHGDCPQFIPLLNQVRIAACGNDGPWARIAAPRLDKLAG